MITIDYRPFGAYHRLRISGHAGYAPHGQDIVCAGVSAIAMALLDHLHSVTGLQADCSSGELCLRCPRGTAADGAMEMALAGWRRIAGTYPHHAEVISPSQKGAEKENA